MGRGDSQGCLTPDVSPTVAQDLDLVLREPQLDRGEQIAKLRRRAGAGDRSRHRWLIIEPRERDRRHWNVVVRRDLVQRLQQAEAVLVRVLARLFHPLAVRHDPWTVLAGEEPVGERRVREAAQTLTFAQARQSQLVLLLVDQVVMLLDSNVPRGPVTIADLERLHETWRGDVRRRDVANLSLANEPVERSECPFEWRVLVVDVRVVQVDPIRAEPPEGRLSGRPDDVGAQTFEPPCLTDLRREHDAITHTVLRHPAPDD